MFGACACACACACVRACVRVCVRVCEVICRYAPCNKDSRDHMNTIQIYSMAVMTHLIALNGGQSSQGTLESLTPAYDAIS